MLDSMGMEMEMGPHEFRVIGGDDPESTQPSQTTGGIETAGAAEFSWRRQEQLVQAAYAAGCSDSGDALALAAKVAGVPESFLNALRFGHRAEITIHGMAVTVIPARSGTVDPDAVLAAWNALRALVVKASEGATGDVEQTAQDLPKQITSARWETLEGHKVRLRQTRWLRRQRRGGVVSLIPLAGLASVKIACVSAAVVVGVGIAEIPNSPPTSLTPDDQPARVVMREEYVPPVDGRPHKTPARPMKFTRTHHPGHGTGHGHQIDHPRPRPATKPTASTTPRQTAAPQTTPPVPDTPPLVTVPSGAATILHALTD